MEEQYSQATRLKALFFSEISVHNISDDVIELVFFFMCSCTGKMSTQTTYIITVVIYRILTFRVDSKAQLLATLFKYLGCIGTERCVHWQMKNSSWVAFLTIIKGCTSFSGP